MRENNWFAGIAVLVHEFLVSQTSAAVYFKSFCGLEHLHFSWFVSGNSLPINQPLVGCVAARFSIGLGDCRGRRTLRYRRHRWWVQSDFVGCVATRFSIGLEDF